MNNRCLTQMLVAALLCAPLILRAESNRNGTSQSPAQCGNALQECFTYEGAAQTNCFYSVSRHPFCEGTQLGRVIFKRWAMSPDRLANSGSDPLMSDSQQVGNACLVEVDRAWSAALTENDLSEVVLAGIGGRLDTCLAGIRMELPRP